MNRDTEYCEKGRAPCYRFSGPNRVDGFHRWPLIANRHSFSMLLFGTQIPLMSDGIRCETKISGTP